MQGIFISYRRDDSEGQAGRLYDDLVRCFGQDSVFMDVAGIEPGLDFRKVIDQNVASCGVLLAVIGPGWLDSKDETGRRRLDNPMDFVRLETASALKRDIAVIPVLVHGAKIPRVEQLPEGLQELAYRNCLELTHTRWDSDMGVLIQALQRRVGGEQTAEVKVRDESEPPEVDTEIHNTEDTEKPVRKPWSLVVVAVATLAVMSVLFYIFSHRAPAFRIAGVLLRADPNHYYGPCPVTVTFSGRISAVGGSGVASYKYLRSDGADAPIQSVTFDQPGSKDISTTWGPFAGETSGWQSIQILDPKPAESPHANFRVRCQARTPVPPPSGGEQQTQGKTASTAQTRTIVLVPMIENMGAVTGAKSGSLVHGMGRTFSPPEIGQMADRREMRAFLSFDLSQIPLGAQIIKAQLRCVQGGGSGPLDPNFFSTVLIESIRINGSLSAEDFARPGILARTVPLTDLRTPQDVTDAVVLVRQAGNSIITFRLRFSIGHSNENRAQSFALEYSRGATSLQVSAR